MVNFTSTAFISKLCTYSVCVEGSKEGVEINPISHTDFNKIHASRMYMYCQLVLTSLGTLFKFCFTNSGIINFMSFLAFPMSHRNFYPHCNCDTSPLPPCNQDVHRQLSCIRFFPLIICWCHCKIYRCFFIKNFFALWWFIFFYIECM